MFILSSYGFRSPVIYEKLKEIVTVTPDKTVVIIPFAGFNEEQIVLLETKAMVDFGFNPKGIYTIDSVQNMDFSPDYVYVPGGDPFKLLSELNRMKYIEKIKKWIKNGADYIGVSAGAYLATENIEYVKQLESNELDLEDFDSLGIIKAAVICHYDQYGLSYYHAVKLVSDSQIYTINNDDVLVI